MISRSARTVSAVVSSIAILFAATACVSNNREQADLPSALTVTSSASECAISAATAPSGTLSFTVSNTGDQVTEFYLLAEDALRIVGEVENIGPGIQRTLVVQASPGDYFTVCKPGMVGAGIGKSAFTVTNSGKKLATTGDEKSRIDAAAKNYVAYVRNQVEGLVSGTAEFLAAYRAGDDDRARALYAITRAAYERIEPVAESFGDLDPKIDFREADVEAGTEWTGWHRIEKDLWPPASSANGGVAYVALNPAERAHFSDLLETDTGALNDAVHEANYTVSIDAISNGAIGLLDEVASGKITGEEEIWSHTDLWDFQANLEGARVAYEGVRDIVKPKDPKLVKQIDGRFSALDKLLSGYGNLENGFVSYTELTDVQVRELSDSVNALAEPLSKLTGVLVG